MSSEIPPRSRAAWLGRGAEPKSVDTASNMGNVGGTSALERSEPLAAEDRAARTRPTDLAIRVECLGKQYRIGETPEKYKTLRDTIVGMAKAPWKRFAGGAGRHGAERTIWALRDVSFEVHRGEVVGIIGRNGAGKSTLLKILSRITEPSEGRAEIHGRVASLLEVGTGFHSELTGRENIYLNGAFLGMRRAEMQSKFDEIVAFAEIEKFVDTTVKHYSSGMYMRLAFAIAAFLEPEILLVDEVLAVGDVLFQQKCLGKMEDVARTGRTILFVSHNMAAVRSLCTRGIVLHEGRVTEVGSVGPCIESYFRQIGAFQESEAGESGVEAGSVGFGRVLVNESGSNSWNHSEPLEVSTTLRFGQEASGFNINLNVADAQGRAIFQVFKQSTAIGLRSIAKGDQYSISVLLPPIWLNPGLYTAHFKVLIWGHHAKSRFLSDKVPIDVTGNYGPESAVINPPAEWRAARRPT